MIPTRVRAALWAALLMVATAAPVAAQHDEPIRRLTIVGTTYNAFADHNISNLQVNVGDRTFAADFWDYYRGTGAASRWGLPLSEVFEEGPGHLTQYFQQGVVDWRLGPAGIPTIGVRPAWDVIEARVFGSGAAAAAEAALANPFASDRTGSWRHSVSDRSIEGSWTGFASFIAQLGGQPTLGRPQSEARRDDAAGAVFRLPGTSPAAVRQYFQNAVLEWLPARDPAVKLAPLGVVLRNLGYPGESWPTRPPFTAAAQLPAGATFVPIRLPEIADGDAGATGAPTFTFTAAGDYGASDEARLTLQAIAAAQPDFHLALGDLSYGETRSEQAWCDLVTAALGAGFPFQLVPGNHDLESGAHIDRFARCLPNRMPASTGQYPTAYFFDYAGLARVITVAPDLGIDGHHRAYRFGDPDYEWLRGAIDGARAAGIPWVIVAMHKNCLSAGTKHCEIGADVLNLLIAERVDLVLQGHDHTYQRGLQLALSRECPLLFAERFNPACIANDAASTGFQAGAGTLIVIAGTGGRPLYGLNPSDADRGYFAVARGAGSGGAPGFVRFDVSATEIRGAYVMARSAHVSDTFVIRRAPGITTGSVDGNGAGQNASVRAPA